MCEEAIKTHAQDRVCQITPRGRRSIVMQTHVAGVWEGARPKDWRKRGERQPVKNSGQVRLILARGRWE